MRFTKMQGCGNDYVYIDCFREHVENPSDLAVRISDRHYGVGGDGMILICPSDSADARMWMFNQDGSEGSMCGNGLRCVTKYIYDHGIIEGKRRSASIETGAGIREVTFTVDGNKVGSVTADMGKAIPGASQLQDIHAAGMDLKYLPVDIGNPHAVYFLEDNPAFGVSGVGQLPLESFGEQFECHERFPDRVNSEFIEILSPSEINFRVYERGSGETLACGTGASASVAAGAVLGKLSDEVLVHLIGGDLSIRYDAKTGHCFMTGPAVEVFHGEYEDL